MAHSAAMVVLSLGLVLAVGFFITLRRKLGQATSFPLGAFNIGCSLFAVAPAVLIKVGVIAQTTASVSLAICYFLVFSVGAIFVDSKAIKSNDSQFRK